MVNGFHSNVLPLLLVRSRPQWPTIARARHSISEKVDGSGTSGQGRREQPQSPCDPSESASQSSAVQDSGSPVAKEEIQSVAAVEVIVAVEVGNPCQPDRCPANSASYPVFGRTSRASSQAPASRD